MISLFFVVSFVCFLSGLVLVYKVPEGVSLFRSVIICIITELCFGAVVVGIYSLVGVPIHLISLSIAYLIMGAAVWGIILYQRKVQRLEILKVDVYSMIIIILWFLGIFIIVFSPSILLVYINSDPAVHYKNALNVLNTGRVSAMYFAETYNGIVMGLLSPFLTKYSLYKAFILADSFANLLNVFMFYCLVSPFVKSRFTKMLVPFLCFLYFAGWPFQSYVSGGFVYFVWGVTLFSYVVYMMIKLYESKERRIQLVLLGLVLLGCFSVLVCYLLFITILAPLVLISLMCIAKKKNIVVYSKYKIRIVITILLMAFGVFSFCFWGYFHGDMARVFETLRIDGGIHKELYQDFLFLLPAVFYMGWNYIKNKENNIIFISVSVTLVYIIFSFVICLCGIMSPYYYFKSYYLLWVFVWIMNILFVEYWIERDKMILFSYGGMLIFAGLMALSGVGSALEKKGVATYSSAVPIWDAMQLFIAQEHYMADKDALRDLSKYIDETFPEEVNIPMLGDTYFLNIWYNSFTDNDSIYITSGEVLAESIEECKEMGYQYVVVYQNTERYWDNRELLNGYESVYNNGYYGIYMLY